MTQPDLSILGNSGIKQYSGVVAQELHPRLRGTFGPKVYREMSDNDSIVGALLYAIETWVCSVKWTVEPGTNNSPVADAWAEFVDGAREDMSHTWSDFMCDILSMLPFGWAYFETVYKIRGGLSDNPQYRSKFDDGLIGWRKIQNRAQDTLIRWEFDEDGGVRGMWQRPPPNTFSTTQEIFLPIEKSLLFRTKIAGNNPEVARSCAIRWSVTGARRALRTLRRSALSVTSPATLLSKCR